MCNVSIPLQLAPNDTCIANLVSATVLLLSVLRSENTNLNVEFVSDGQISQSEHRVLEQTNNSRITQKCIIITEETSNDLSQCRLRQFAMREQITNEKPHSEGTRAGSREVDLLRRTGNILASLNRCSRVRTRGREQDARTNILEHTPRKSVFHERVSPLTSCSSLIASRIRVSTRREFHNSNVHRE